ncbi:hypothetical protein [Pseudomonas sp. GM21]
MKFTTSSQSEGGTVYDLDNLQALTPKQHIETHSKKNRQTR